MTNVGSHVSAGHPGAAGTPADAPARVLRPELPNTHVLLPGGRRLLARYAVAPIAELLTSHEPADGDLLRVREGYPRRIQYREYEGIRGASAAVAVYEAAQRIDPEQLLDPTRTTVTGPPVVARWPHERGPTLVCVAGNQRVLLFLAARKLNTPRAVGGIRAYLRRLRAEAADFGIPPDVVSGIPDDGDPHLLVRIAEGWDRPGPDEPSAEFPREQEALAAVLGRINRASDGSFTKARDVVSLAHSIAAEVRAVEAERNHYAVPLGTPTPLQHLRQTLQDRGAHRYLTSPDGAQFFRRLLQHGVVPREERAAYLVPSGGRHAAPRDHDAAPAGRLNAVGRVLLQAAFSALVFEDARIEDVVPPSILRRVHAAGALLLEFVATRPEVSPRANASNSV